MSIIKIKKSGSAGTTPASLEFGELALNYADGKLFYKNSSNAVVAFTGEGGGSSGSNSALTAKVDALTFNGSTSTFNLTSGGTAIPTLSSASNLLISLNGVIQEPGVSYSVSGTSITFLQNGVATAPAADTVFFGVVFYSGTFGSGAGTFAEGSHNHSGQDISPQTVTPLVLRRSAKAATTAALANSTFSDGTITGNSGIALPTIDGVTLAVDDRLLVKDQTAQAQNGIYRVVQATAPFSITRTSDANTSDKLIPGMLVYVEQGTANANQFFLLNTTAAATVNTTSLPFLPLFNPTGNTVTAFTATTGSTLNLGIGGISNTVNIGTGSAATGTKNVNIATGSWMGGTTNVSIGVAGGGTTTINNNLVAGGTVSVNVANPAIATTQTSGTATVFGGSFNGTVAVGNNNAATQVSIPSTQASTSTASGGLVVAGGAGIGGALFTGGNVSTAGNLIGTGASSVVTVAGSAVNINGSNPSIATTQTTGTAGVFVSNIPAINIGTTASTTIGIGASGSTTTFGGGSTGGINVASTLASTTTSNGALRVGGGAGIGGAVNVGSNLTSAGQISTTRAGNSSTGAGQIYLNGATANRIDFNANGLGGPSVTTRSNGTKICLYPIMNGTQGDYAIGINNSTFWNSVPSSGDSFQWYAGTNNILSLNGNGALYCTSQFTTPSLQLVGETSGTYEQVAWLTFYNGSGSYGDISGFISNKTLDSQENHSLVFGVNSNESVAVMKSGGILINPGLAPNNENTPLETSLDVYGAAKVTGRLTVQGGLQSPGEMLYLWSNFR